MDEKMSNMKCLESAQPLKNYISQKCYTCYLNYCLDNELNLDIQNCSDCRCYYNDCAEAAYYRQFDSAEYHDSVKIKSYDYICENLLEIMEKEVVLNG